MGLILVIAVSERVLSLTCLTFLSRIPFTLRPTKPALIDAYVIRHEFDVTYFRQNSSITFPISATSIGDSINSTANTLANSEPPTSFNSAVRSVLCQSTISQVCWVSNLES